MTSTLRRALARGALLGARMSWLFVALQLAGGVSGAAGAPRAAGSGFPPLWMMLLLPLSFCALGLARRLTGRVLLQMAVWVAAGVVVVAAALNIGLQVPLYLGLPAGALLWGAGFRPAVDRSGAEKAVRELQLGIMALVVFLALSHGLHLDLRGAGVAAVLCVMLGLLAAAFANERGSLGPLGSGGWWTVLLLSVLAVAGVALVVAVIVTPDLLASLGRTAARVWGRIDAVLGAVANLIPDPSGGSGAMPTAPGAEGGGVGSGTDGVLPTWLLRMVRVAFSIFVAVCTAAVVWLMSRRLLALGRRANEGRGEVEPLRGAFRVDLVGWLRRIMRGIGGLLGWRSSAGTAPPGHLDPPEITSVRELYRLLLQRAAGKGLPRRGFETPQEYQAVLATALDGDGDALDRLTTAYVAARYGALAPAPGEWEELAAAWRRVQRHL